MPVATGAAEHQADGRCYSVEPVGPFIDSCRTRSAHVVSYLATEDPESIIHNNTGMTGAIVTLHLPAGINVARPCDYTPQLDAS